MISLYGPTLQTSELPCYPRIINLNINSSTRTRTVSASPIWHTFYHDGSTKWKSYVHHPSWHHLHFGTLALSGTATEIATYFAYQTYRLAVGSRALFHSKAPRDSRLLKSHQFLSPSPYLDWTVSPIAPSRAGSNRLGH